MPCPKNLRKSIIGYGGGVIFTVVIGAVLIWCRVGKGLADLSYDLPFLFRSNIEMSNVVIVYLDRKAQGALQQSSTRWDRRLHAQLVRRLTDQKSKLVFFDILFVASDERVDPDFAEAIRKNGKVVLGATSEETVQQTVHSPVAALQTVKLPTAVLRSAAAAVGLVQVQVDSKFSARTIFTGRADAEAAVWAAAALAGASVTRDPQTRLSERWLNFYGPGKFFDAVSLSDALSENGTPTNFFRGKFVFVGGDPVVFGERDTFATPYNRFGGEFTPGVEVLATSFLNLVRGDWLERIGAGKQLAMVTLWGMLVGIGLMLLRPWHAAWVALLAALAVAAIALYLQCYHRLCWSWLVPSAVQTPIALGWAVGWQYSVESRKRKKLRQAFGAYLSPYMADRIAASEFDLSLGGKLVEATVMFSDLAGFTGMSETLDPAVVSQILTSCFNRTTRAILEQDGTILKYMGDAVMAVWGAPVKDPRQAERAVLAACGMIEAGKSGNGPLLRTRIGINTGQVLAGNLGSDFRFDYTAIGATTNLASRLEALNKYLGTDILISDSTRQQLSPAIQLRYVGRFLTAGTTVSVKIYEVLAAIVGSAVRPEWIGSFEQGLDFFVRREWDQAEALLRKTSTLRGQEDGPAQFYLAQISQLRATLTRDAVWDGVVTLASK